MLNRRHFAALAPLLAPVAASRASAQSLEAATLFGSWRLVDAATVDQAGNAGEWGGRTRPYAGLIIYQASGFVSVQISSARQPAPLEPNFVDMPAAQRLSYLASYYGYYGTFDFDAAQSIVQHHVQSSLDPTEIGVTLRRKASLQNGLLTLTTLNDPDRPEPTFNRLTWRRA